VPQNTDNGQAVHFLGDSPPKPLNPWVATAGAKRSVITQGEPQTASSTTVEKAALAFSQLNFFQPFPQARAFLSL